MIHEKPFQIFHEKKKTFTFSFRSGVYVNCIKQTGNNVMLPLHLCLFYLFKFLHLICICIMYGAYIRNRIIVDKLFNFADSQ